MKQHIKIKKALNESNEKVAHLKQTHNVKAKTHISVKFTGQYPQIKSNKERKYNKTSCKKKPNQIKTRIRWKRRETRFKPKSKLICKKVKQIRFAQLIN